jgi:hypothetical protein
MARRRGRHAAGTFGSARCDQHDVWPRGLCLDKAFCLREGFQGLKSTNPDALRRFFRFWWVDAGRRSTLLHRILQCLERLRLSLTDSGTAWDQRFKSARRIVRRNVVRMAAQKYGLEYQTAWPGALLPYFPWRKSRKLSASPGAISSRLLSRLKNLTSLFLSVSNAL